MQRDPSYRQVYRMWRALHQSMVIDPGASFDLAIIDLPLLYERWCALRVVQSLLSLSETVYACHLLMAPVDETESWALDLRRDLPLLVARRHGWTLTLRYQPRYPPAVSARSDNTFVSLDRHTRIPDLAIEATRPGHPPRVIVLDAKYRLDADGCAVPADALAEAYAYASAIGAAGAPSVAAALILYPGTGEAERYPGGAGAIPLLPGAVDALDAALAAELAELDRLR
jgi:large subunit ribosomal protein MRP49